MRVTNSLMSKSYLRNLNNQTNRVLKYQKQLSSLKEVSKPSDDPLTVSKILDLKDNIIQNERYLGTIDDAIDWTNVQDSALEQASNSLGRIRTLIQSAANGTMTQDDRKAILNDVKGEIESFRDAANTSFGGRYVFAGAKNDKSPFTSSFEVSGGKTELTFEYTGDTMELTREVAPGVDVRLQTNGQDLTKFSEDDDIGEFFKEVISALESENPKEIEKLGGELLDRSDQAIDNVVEMRANVGSTFKRLEAAKNRNESEKINLKSILSSKEDVDLAEKYMEYSMEMVAYDASLQIGTRILQSNILNFL